METLSYCSTQDYDESGNVKCKLHKRVSIMYGFADNIACGDTGFTDPRMRTVTPPLYCVKPMASMAFDFRHGFTCKTLRKNCADSGLGMARLSRPAAFPEEKFSRRDFAFSIRQAPYVKELGQRHCNVPHDD
jgi:hypothetical protein